MIELVIAPTAAAHAVHYAVLGVGFLGLFALLGPQLVGGRREVSAPDDHARRVRALADQISVGRLGATMMPPPQPAAAAAPLTVDLIGTRYLPIAVVSSAAAAGVHAAVGPAHFGEGLVFGLFFAAAALAQVGWALVMALRPSRRLLIAAVAGNTAILLLWLVTRTIGLPGLLPEPEAMGLWDLSCGVFEVAVIVTAARILRRGPGIGLRLTRWSDWEPFARGWTLVAASALPVLALTGVGA